MRFNNQKKAQLYKISTGGATAATDFFHLWLSFQRNIQILWIQTYLYRLSMSRLQDSRRSFRGRKKHCFHKNYDLKFMFAYNELLAAPWEQVGPNNITLGFWYHFLIYNCIELKSQREEYFDITPWNNPLKRPLFASLCSTAKKE